MKDYWRNLEERGAWVFWTSSYFWSEWVGLRPKTLHRSKGRDTDCSSHEKLCVEMNSFISGVVTPQSASPGSSMLWPHILTTMRHKEKFQNLPECETPTHCEWEPKKKRILTLDRLSGSLGLSLFFRLIFIPETTWTSYPTPSCASGKHWESTHLPSCGQRGWHPCHLSWRVFLSPFLMGVPVTFPESAPVTFPGGHSLPKLRAPNLNAYRQKKISLFWFPESGGQTEYLDRCYRHVVPFWRHGNWIDQGVLCHKSKAFCSEVSFDWR